MADQGFTPEELAELRRFAAEQQAFNEAEAERLGVVDGIVLERKRAERKARASEPPAPDEPPPEFTSEDEGSALPPRTPLDWNALEGREPPPRQWVEPEWLPEAGCLLAGGAGIGKTLLVQTWASLLALGRGYVNVPHAPQRILMWAGEDPEEELWRRQVVIANWLGVALAQFSERLVLQSYDGEEMALAGNVQGRLCPTAMLTELREQIGDYRAQYVFLDNSARLYAGPENDRHMVTTFCALVVGACRKGGAAGFCLLSHPSKALGSEFSGSTAWEASVRSRMFLGRALPDQEPATPHEDVQDDGVRYLARRKANYSDRDWIKLAYRDGVFAPLPRERSNDGRYQPRGEYAKDVVLRALRKVLSMGEIATGSRASPVYLLKQARNFELMEGVSPKEFEKALNSLRAEGRLTLRVVGQYPNRTPKYGLAEAAEKPE